MRINAETVWEAIPKTPVCFLGWGLVSVWSNVMYLHPAVLFPGLSGASRSAFDLVLVGTMVLIAVITRCRQGFAPLIGQRWAMPAALTMLLLCTAINFQAAVSGFAPAALTWTALLVGGVGTALMMLLASEFFGFIHPKRTILYMASGWLVGAISAAFLRVLPLPYLWMCMMAVPVVTTLCIWRAYKTLSVSELTFMTSRRFSFPWLPLVPIALCAVVKRWLNALVVVAVDPEVVNDAGMVVAALVVLGGLARYGGNLNTRSLWKLGVGLMSCSVALFVVASYGNSAVAGSAAALASSSAYYILFLLMTAIFANISYRWGVCALWLFSIEHASHLLAGTGAMVGMEWLMGTGGVPDVVLDASFVLLALLSMAVVALLFRRYSPDSLWGLSMGDESSFGESERVHRVCESLIEEHALTPREGEILFMSMQGKRPAEIANELFIEVSTTRTHIKHIYTKLDIHSRSELLEIVGKPVAM